jgi:hypothetical protein
VIIRGLGLGVGLAAQSGPVSLLTAVGHQLDSER